MYNLYNLKVMKVNLHAVNFNVDKKLVDFVQEKVDKLEKYYDKIVSSDVFLKVENTSDKENKIVEIKINVPGDDFVVKKTTKSFEEGIDLAVDSLERVLVKRKEKLRIN
jgi:putative sigma-54 modulation protein